MTTNSQGSDASRNDRRPAVFWGEPVAGIRLGISLRRTYRLREPVLMDVVIVNDGREPVNLSESHFLVDYAVALEKDDGAVVPWTTEGEAARVSARQRVWARRMVTIEAGQEHTAPGGQLDEWFHLEEPGRYQVHVTRPDWTREHGAPLKSSASFSIVAD